MRNNKFIFVIGVMLFYISLGYATEFPQGINVSLPHKINYQLPNDTSWQLENQISDFLALVYEEYYKSDVGSTRYKMFLTYRQNIKIPLVEYMKQVLESPHRNTCLIQDSKILKKGPNFIVFSTLVDKCPKDEVPPAELIWKVFNMPDGQYSIMLSTNNPRPTDPTFLNKLKNMVMSSRIV